MRPEQGALVGGPSKYPPEFRREAVELVKASERPRVEVARSLGISDSTLANWMDADRDAEARARDPEGLKMTDLEELRQLRKEVIELRTDREILRKAAAARCLGYGSLLEGKELAVVARPGWATLAVHMSAAEVIPSDGPNVRSTGLRSRGLDGYDHVLQ